MDCFPLLIDALYFTGQALLQLLFASRLTGKALRLWILPVYLSLLGAIGLFFARLSVGGVLAAGAGVLVLYVVSRLGLKAPPLASWLAAVLAFCVSQLSAGIVSALEAALFPRYIGAPLLYPLLLAAQVLFFLLCAGCYAAILRLLSWTQDRQMPYISLLLFPGLFCLAVELYILQTAYSFFAPSSSLEELGKQGTLLLLQVLGLAALLCALYAYRRLCQGFQAQAALQSLTQAAQAQKVYLAEARLRWEQTRAFRHDIRNHLSVLDGLLRGGRLEEGRAYLKKLEAVSSALSFPHQTGDPVVDILLGEKLGLAKEIQTEVSLVLPPSWGIDSLDLCVIFANALDNAIAACRAGGGPPSIRITGQRQGDLYLLAFENTCPAGPLPPAGTGLANIRAAAEKYQGAVLAEKTDQRFSLHVLLHIP